MRETAHNTSDTSLLIVLYVHYYELIMVQDINSVFFVKEKNMLYYNYNINNLCQNGHKLLLTNG